MGLGKILRSMGGGGGWVVDRVGRRDVVVVVLGLRLFFGWVGGWVGGWMGEKMEENARVEGEGRWVE